MDTERERWKGDRGWTRRRRWRGDGEWISFRIRGDIRWRIGKGKGEGKDAGSTGGIRGKIG